MKCTRKAENMPRKNKKLKRSDGLRDLGAIKNANNPVINSTNGYNNEILVLQLEHRPLKNK